MKRLVLMRHAKSSWASPGLRDHDRPLNERGRRSAKALGDWIRANNIFVNQVLVSSSTRTLETLRLLELECEREVLDSLYHADHSAMMSALNSATGQTVLMLGHNPGIAYFAHRLVSAPPNHPRFDDYPTCATLVAQFDIDGWSDLQPGQGKATAFVIPRELIE